MNILCVFGSRKITKAGLVQQVISEGLLEFGLRVRDIDLLIHGDAAGVDRLSGDWARRFGIPIDTYPAAWKKKVPGQPWKKGPYGYFNPLAGHNRNQILAETASVFVGISRDGSTGTADMRNRVLALQKPIYFREI